MLRQHLRISSALALGLSLLVAIGLPTALCPAATISYGSLGPIAPTNITFTNISESSLTDPVPLYGPPSAFVTGLDFNPASFGASAFGSGPNAIDITDGQVNFTVTGSNQFPINSISLFESGDYGLDGTGTPATKSKAFAIIQATIKEINGIAVSPISFPINPASATAEFKLGIDPDDGGWSLATALNIAGQLGANQRATKVDISIDNRLTAFSESASLAFIAKKEFLVGVGTNEIPEPGTIVLALTCCMGLLALSRRRT